jgi:hypothetical protein
MTHGHRLTHPKFLVSQPPTQHHNTKHSNSTAKLPLHTKLPQHPDHDKPNIFPRGKTNLQTDIARCDWEHKYLSQERDRTGPGTQAYKEAEMKIDELLQNGKRYERELDRLLVETELSFREQVEQLLVNSTVDGVRDEVEATAVGSEADVIQGDESGPRKESAATEDKNPNNATTSGDSNLAELDNALSCRTRSRRGSDEVSDPPTHQATHSSGDSCEN